MYRMMDSRPIGSRGRTYPPEPWKKAFPAEKKWPRECDEARKDCFEQEFQFLQEW